MTLETQRHHSRESRIDKAQPNTLARFDRHLIRYRAIDCDRVAETTGHRRVHHATETRRDLRFSCKAPIGNHPNELTVAGDWLQLFNDQCTGHTAPELAEAIGMRVVPERPGIRWCELIGESLARFYRLLGEPGHAVHCVGKPDAVPVHGRFLR